MKARYMVLWRHHHASSITLGQVYLYRLERFNIELTWPTNFLSFMCMRVRMTVNVFTNDYIHLGSLYLFIETLKRNKEHIIVNNSVKTVLFSKHQGPAFRDPWIKPLWKNLDFYLWWWDNSVFPNKLTKGHNSVFKLNIQIILKAGVI